MHLGPPSLCGVTQVDLRVYNRYSAHAVLRGRFVICVPLPISAHDPTWPHPRLQWPVIGTVCVLRNRTSQYWELPRNHGLGRAIQLVSTHSCPRAHYSPKTSHYVPMYLSVARYIVPVNHPSCRLTRKQSLDPAATNWKARSMLPKLTPCSQSQTPSGSKLQWKGPAVTEIVTLNLSAIQGKQER